MLFRSRMAGNARYTALLDACVLYPVSVADALMSVAVTGLFAPKWTTEIEAEWMRNLEAENAPISSAGSAFAATTCAKPFPIGRFRKRLGGRSSDCSRFLTLMTSTCLPPRSSAMLIAS